MSRRIQKVAELLRELLALMVKEALPEELGLVTVIDVEVTADLKNAVVYISCFEKQYQDRVLRILTENVKNFQHILGRKLQIKYTPRLEFKIYAGLEKINRIEAIIESLH